VRAKLLVDIELPKTVELITDKLLLSSAFPSADTLAPNLLSVVALKPCPKMPRLHDDKLPPTYAKSFTDSEDPTSAAPNNENLDPRLAFCLTVRVSSKTTTSKTDKSLPIRANAATETRSPNDEAWATDRKIPS
jgi:hypothetical protein